MHDDGQRAGVTSTPAADADPHDGDSPAMPSLQARLDEYKAASRAKQDPAINAVLEAGIAELRGSHPASRYIRPGALFPDVELPDSNGAPFSLRKQLGEGPVVLSFYRGLWCPYCNLELTALGEVYETLREAGAELVAISPQTAANSNRTIRTKALPFRILVDAGNRIADAAGLRYRLSDTLIQTYKSLGVNLPLINGDDSWTLPIPARVVVTAQGDVHSISADPDYTHRPEPAETVRAVVQLNASIAS